MTFAPAGKVVMASLDILLTSRSVPLYFNQRISLWNVVEQTSQNCVISIRMSDLRQMHRMKLLVAAGTVSADFCPGPSLINQRKVPSY